MLSWGDQHDAAEALELLFDGLSAQLQLWVADSLAPGLLTPSLAHLQAFTHLPACIGKLALGSSPVSCPCAALSSVHLTSY